MSKAQKRKKPKKPRKPKGSAGGGRPLAQVDQNLAAAARDNVVAIIGQGRVPERAREIALSAFFLADHLTRRLEAEQTLPHPVACQEGCDSCCYNQVELTPPEALLIGHHIARQFFRGRERPAAGPRGPDHRDDRPDGQSRDRRAGGGRFPVRCCATGRARCTRSGPWCAGPCTPWTGGAARRNCAPAAWRAAPIIPTATRSRSR